MSKKQAMPAPLVAVKRTASSISNIWDRLDYAIKGAMENGYSWNSSVCPCPIAVAIACLVDTGLSPVEASSKAGIVSAEYAWRKVKRIYRFNSELATEVINTEWDLVIPIDIIHYMPEPCIYVQTDVIPDIDGFFATIEYDIELHHEELRFYMIDSDGDINNACIIHMDVGQTLQQGIDKAIKTMHNNANNELLKRLGTQVSQRAVNEIESTRDLSLKVVQLLLYICAENADISENPEQSKIYQKRQNVGDYFREIRKWDVGKHIGEQIRVIKNSKKVKDIEENKEDTDTDENSKITSIRKYKNRPHVRRAHWHHYWVGEGRTKLVLKWVSTLIVNAEDGELDTTILKM